MGAAITRPVGPGTYYVEVDGVGLDDPILGYSDYGSVGTYTLSVTGCAGEPSPPTPTPTPTSTPTPTVEPTRPTPTATSTGTPPTTAYAVPAAPVVRSVKPGRAGLPLTVRLKWQPPAATGGAPVTAYEVFVWKVKPAGRSVSRMRTVLVESAQRHLVLRLPAGRYRFAIAAENFVGTGPRSARTALVSPG